MAKRSKKQTKEGGLTESVRVVMTEERREEYKKLADDQSLGLTGLFDLGFEAVKLLLGKSSAPLGPAAPSYDPNAPAMASTAAPAYYAPPEPDPAAAPKRKRFPAIRPRAFRPPSIHARAARDLFERAVPRSAAYGELLRLATDAAKISEQWRESYESMKEAYTRAQIEAADLRAELASIESSIADLAEKTSEGGREVLDAIVTDLWKRRVARQTILRLTASKEPTS